MDDLQRGRITSTYVENTAPAKMNCGCLSGSPPHTWRIHKMKLKRSHLNRITSTYVENTVHEAKPISDVEDHLHIRGEYTINNIYSTRVLGSPPHTWRIPEHLCCDKATRRITSTYVENTPSTGHGKNVDKDHLHIRGEYYFLHAYHNHPLGSPPHTWRIHFKLTSGDITVRITSTYVENTSSGFSTILIMWDHLHIRGEYFNFGLSKAK